MTLNDLILVSGHMITACLRWPVSIKIRPKDGSAKAINLRSYGTSKCEYWDATNAIEPEPGNIPVITESAVIQVTANKIHVFLKKLGKVEDIASDDWEIDKEDMQAMTNEHESIGRMIKRLNNG